MLKALTPGSAEKTKQKKDAEKERKKELARVIKEKARARKEASRARQPSGPSRRPSGSLEPRRLQDFNLPGAQEVQELPPLGRTRRASREERGRQPPVHGFSSKYLPRQVTEEDPPQSGRPPGPGGAKF